MAKGGGSIHIDRPADEVFAFVADAEPEDDGCRLTIVAEGEFESRVMRLLSPLAIAVAKRQADGDVKRLKAALDSRTEQAL